MRFRNDSGQAAPAGAVMKVTAIDVEDVGRVMLTIEQPDTYGSQCNHVINGRLKVKDGNHGICTFAGDGLVPALYDDTVQPDPPFGELWGPTPGSWKLSQYVGGFQNAGRVVTERILVSQKPFLQVEGTLDAILGTSDSTGSVSSTAELSVFHGTGDTDWVDSGENVTIVNRNDNFSCPADYHLTASWINGEWRPNATPVDPLVGTLTSALSSGGSSTIGSITVYEVIGTVNDIPSGATCFCMWDHSSARYVVVSAECI